ncbi:hypothetical protein [Allonocardiopsis opalescens]|uniref:Uncharacterized protein n=1 Tax=Allonocardiopsis opalescens TaxID=1144618 RepID=A0A2T0Q0D0_9ACTN|nr:hypothetical protein [Allonocardiopsis opalescens]PRX97251.1 hypothetical protein CLV72_106288 [Allonocardiopsis opalescens]
MRVEPDADAADRDERHLTELVHGRLTAFLGGHAVVPPPAALRNPAFHTLAHAAQRATGRGAADLAVRVRLSAELAAVAERVRTDRGVERVHERWTVGLPGPRRHLSLSLRRATGRASLLPGLDGRSEPVAVAEWDGARRAALRDAARLLGDVWPAMLGELAAVVREVALLDGPGLDGLTDFAAHGAVFIGAERLRAHPDGLPGPLGCAEALVREATRTRCDAAAVIEPFLLPEEPGASGGPPVRGPLRADSRPPTALLQRVVVAARTVELYDRSLRAGAGGAGAPRRRAALAERGARDSAALRVSAGALSPRGRELAEEASKLLEWSG